MGGDPTLFDDDAGRRRARPRPTPPPRQARASDRPPDPAQRAPGPPAIGVADLNAAIAARLTEAFPTEVWVKGEVASLRRRNSKHLHFELVERPVPGAPAQARIDAVAFSMRWRRIESQLVRAGVNLEDGTELCVRGTIDYYPPTGRVQFVVTGVDPSFTVGRMAADRDAVLRKLAAEGLLEVNGRLQMPVAPLRVGVVTAAGSAADNDFRQEIERSGFAFRVTVADSRVQGPATVATTIASLRALVGLGVDVVAIVRGGGSRTDLGWFDDERIARAIAAMPVPVFTGIGHEIDTSVADHVAHTALKTPTSCAAALVERVAGFVRDADALWLAITAVAATRATTAEGRVDTAARRCARDAARSIHTAEHYVAIGAERLLRQGPAAAAGAHDRVRIRADRLRSAANATVQRAGGRVQTAAIRLAPRTLLRRLDDATAHLDAAERTARAFDPARVLERGFSLTLDAEGRAVRDAAALEPGTVLHTRFAQGEATSEVIETAERRPTWQSTP